MHFTLQIIVNFLLGEMDSKLGHLTLMKNFFHHSPDYNLCRVFGCKCFPWLKPLTSLNFNQDLLLVTLLDITQQLKAIDALILPLAKFVSPGMLFLMKPFSLLLLWLLLPFLILNLRSSGLQTLPHHIITLLLPPHQIISL